MLFIWSNSLQTADESSQVSLGVLSWFMPFFERFGLPEEVWHTLIRKLAHMTEFAIAGILWSGALSPAAGQPLRIRWMRRGLALVLCLATAVVDECIQLFVPGRSGELRDVCIDMAGSVLGVLAIIVIGKMVLKLRKGTNLYE